MSNRVNLACRQAHLLSQRTSWVHLHITDVHKVPVYFWLSFKLKREQEIKKYLLCCCVHMGEVKYYKCMWLQVGNKTTWTHLSVTSIIKDQIAKARPLGIKRVSLLDRNLDEFFLSTVDIMPACCYERDLQFFQEIWATKVHTSGLN